MPESSSGKSNIIGTLIGEWVKDGGLDTLLGGVNANAGSDKREDQADRAQRAEIECDVYRDALTRVAREVGVRKEITTGNTADVLDAVIRVRHQRDVEGGNALGLKDRVRELEALNRREKETAQHFADLLSEVGQAAGAIGKGGPEDIVAQVKDRMTELTTWREHGEMDGMRYDGPGSLVGDKGDRFRAETTQAELNAAMDGQASGKVTLHAHATDPRVDDLVGVLSAFYHQVRTSGHTSLAALDMVIADLSRMSEASD